MAVKESKSSTKPSNAAEKLTERMLVYSSFRAEQTQEYVKAFTRMLGEFGATRVEQGLTKAIDAHAEFPPTPATIRGYIPRLTAQRVTCSRCSDTEGWLYADRYSVRLCDHSVQP
jgi:hypothetical protein